MTNEQLYFLCVLTGAEELIGVDCPIEGLTEEEVKAKWSAASIDLYEHKMLYNDEQGEICLSDNYAKITAAISFPDTVFISASQSERMVYIYIKGNIYVTMQNEGQCDVNLYESKDEFIAFLHQEFMLTSCEKEWLFNVNVVEMDEAVDLYHAGQTQQAITKLEAGGVHAEAAEQVLDSFVNSRSCNSFVGYKKNRETASEASFKSVRTEEGTIIFKINNQVATINRSHEARALAEIMNF